MNPLLKFYRLLNILSIDVALGAVCCAAWFAKMFEVQLWSYALLVLGLTVWAIYTADHLMDAKRIKKDASTERHRFHQQHFNVLIVCLAVAVIADVFFLFFIRTKILYAGFLLSIVVVLYLLMNRKLNYVKELVIAFVYCTGILLPVLSLNDFSVSLREFLMVVAFLLTALINLILFSLYDRQSDKLDGYNSFVLRFGVDGTRRMLNGLFLLQSLVIITLLVRSSFEAAALFLAMNSILLLLFLRPSSFRQHESYRLFGDAIFVFPVVFLVFG